MIPDDTTVELRYCMGMDIGYTPTRESALERVLVG